VSVLDVVKVLFFLDVAEDKGERKPGKNFLMNGLIEKADAQKRLVLTSIEDQIGRRYPSQVMSLLNLKSLAASIIRPRLAPMARKLNNTTVKRAIF
jgi:hypothetical protein